MRGEVTTAGSTDHDGSSRAALPHAIALAFGGEYGRVMRQAIEQRGRELLVAGKDGDPFGEGEVGSDDRGSALIAVGEQIEEQLAARTVEGYEAELVDDEHVDAQQSWLQARELAGIAGFEELAHQVGRAGEEHPTFLLGGFDADNQGTCSRRRSPFRRSIGGAIAWTRRWGTVDLLPQRLPALQRVEYFGRGRGFHS
jgi:hypothetical protein